MPLGINPSIELLVFILVLTTFVIALYILQGKTEAICYIASVFPLVYPKYLYGENCIHPMANKFLVDFGGAN